ncbi:MAG TPA: SOS response-associated peptidase [Flavobacteriales bacterium]|jgi:putative SOS response-associated peptidase YedK|nr:SOS response-associated peptidase [Flavobacteriales bacterium]
MCGRYTIVTKLESIEKRFNVKTAQPELLIPNTNVSPGDKAPVITNQHPDILQFFHFGLTPFWAKKRMYFFNARAEGDHNKENNPQYSGAKGIVNKPSFRKAIRSQRCLIPADCFIEGPEKEKLSKPYVVYLRNGQRPFSFAGIWDIWTDKETGEIVQGFSIITTVSNKVTQKIGHHRSPVILHPDHEQTWLNSNADLGEITELLRPYDARQMNAYPIDPMIKNPRVNGLELLNPIGERLFPEQEFNLTQYLKLEGMGMTRARQRP